MNGVAGETEVSRSSAASACKQRQAEGDQQLLCAIKQRYRQTSSELN